MLLRVQTNFRQGMWRRDPMTESNHQTLANAEHDRSTWMRDRVLSFGNPWALWSKGQCTGRWWYQQLWCLSRQGTSSLPSANWRATRVLRWAFFELIQWSWGSLGALLIWLRQKVPPPSKLPLISQSWWSWCWSIWLAPPLHFLLISIKVAPKIG